VGNQMQTVQLIFYPLLSYWLWKKISKIALLLRFLLSMKVSAF